MTTVVFTRPAVWEGMTSKLNLIHVPIGGLEPKRNSGRPAGDGIGVVALPERMKELETVLRNTKPELFVRAVHQRFGRGEMQRCRDASPDTIWLLMEGNQPWTASRYVTRLREFVDVVLINNYSSGTIKAYLDMGIAVVPGFWDGFDPVDHKTRPISATIWDCFFGGSNLKKDGKWLLPAGKERHDFIMKVAAEFDLELRGPAAEWDWPPQPILSHKPCLEAMQRSKITLGYNQIHLERYYTRRTIHSGASGRLLVTRYIPEMEKDFNDWRGPVWFKTNQGGIDLIKYYLNHSKDREQLAESQRRWFMKCHTWEARLRKLERLTPYLLERKVVSLEE